ncbi:MAG: hypothetical protein QME60_05435 [Verrucomicrobiota bacterium]|nr:hypothetical protein [Verrucomicrobiota bacterium]
MRWTIQAAATGAACWLPLAALALGPHELLLLANGSSPNSVAVAGEFARLRQVPDINIVQLTVPLPPAGQPAEIAPDDFTRLIWAPACRAIRERGIEDRILAWVYSTDFPVVVKTLPPLSIQGLTFLRNRAPAPDAIRKAEVVSPLFAGPSWPGGDFFTPQTLDAAKDWLGADMPMPSMMLGYTGVRGNRKETVLRRLRQGQASDGTAPRGTVYFVLNEDIRSKCRDWQFAAARQELLALGVRAEVTNAFPAEKPDAMGIMMGTAVLPASLGNGLCPGSMAEHLTSAAAVFHSSDQSRLTAWIEAGATASAGTVTEPYAVWEKFPAARFYAHYAAGCSMIESFFQSVKSPVQILLVGDPLAAPWAPAGELVILSADRARDGEPLRISVDLWGGPASVFGRIVVLLDGNGVEDRAMVVSGRGGAPVTLDARPRRLTAGAHTLRVVAYRTGWMRRQAFAERSIEVNADGRAALKP